MEETPKYKHGFKVPEDYFEGLEDRVFSQLEVEKLPVSHGLKVPEGYFEGLDEEILSNVTASEKKPIKVIPLYQKLWVRVSIGIAALWVLGWFIFTPQASNTLEVAEVENYIENYGLDMEAHEIAQLLSEEEIDELILERDFISAESMETYLLQNLNDTSLLME